MGCASNRSRRDASAIAFCREQIYMAPELRKILTAGISAGIAWFILEQTEISSLYKAVTYGIIGVISPEVIAGIVKLGKRFADNPEKVLKK